MHARRCDVLPDAVHCHRHQPDLFDEQIEDMSVDKENTKTQLQAMRADTSHMRLKQQQVEKEVSKEIPQNKVRVVCHQGVLSLRVFDVTQQTDTRDTCSARISVLRRSLLMFQ